MSRLDSSMEHPNVRVERRNQYAIITIDRPEAQNAMTFEMMTALARTFSSLNAESPAPRAIILTG